MTTSAAAFNTRCCFEPYQVARLADTYINCHIGAAASNHGPSSPPSGGGYKPPPLRSFQGVSGGKAERPPGNITASSQSREVRPIPTADDQNRFVMRCWRCQSTNHLDQDCPQGRESRPPTRYSHRVQIAPDEEQTEDQLQTDNMCNRVLCDTESVVLEKQCDNACWEFGNFPEVNYC